MYVIALMSFTRPETRSPTVTAGFKLAPLIGPVMITPANTTNPKVRLKLSFFYELSTTSMSLINTLFERGHHC